MESKATKWKVCQTEDIFSSLRQAIDSTQTLVMQLAMRAQKATIGPHHSALTHVVLGVWNVIRTTSTATSVMDDKLVALCVPSAARRRNLVSAHTGGKKRVTFRFLLFCLGCSSGGAAAEAHRQP